jgi:uncharacterized phage infection (PIP) family protein YhgE
MIHSRFTTSLLVLAFAAGLVGCGSPINQSIKNEVFGLNSALVAISYDLDMANKQLLAAESAIETNKRGIASIPRDSLYQAAIDSLEAQYGRAAKALNTLFDDNRQLQARYLKLHEEFNEFVSQVEQDDLGDDDARLQLRGFTTRFQQVKEAYTAQQGKIEEGLTKHNRDIDGLQRYTRAVLFSRIERVR